MKINIWTVILACGGALLLGGCASTPESDMYEPNITVWNIEDLMKRPNIVLPPGFNTGDFKHLVMAVNFKATNKIPQGGDGDPLQVDPNLSTRFQAEIAKLKRFQVVALHGTDTEYDLSGAADLSNGNLVIHDQDKPLCVNVLLQGELSASRSRTVIRGRGADPDIAQVVYKVYVVATCKDLQKGTVVFAETAVGKARTRIQTLVNGRPRGGFDANEQSTAIWEAAQNALIEICNKLGNTYPAGGVVTGISRSGDNLMIDRGLEEGVGANQPCVIAVDDDGVILPIALAEAAPANGQPKSALKICKWNTSDKDAKQVVRELKKDPKKFLKNYSDKFYGVCYGMAVPPEWERNATK